MKLLVLLAILAVPQDSDLDALLKQLEDESIEVREKAVAALVERGDEAEAKIRARMASAQGAFKSQLESLLQSVVKERRLRAIYPRTRRVSIDVKDTPLREVLERLQKESGLPIDAGLVGDPKLTVKVADVMPLEALDAVCRSANVDFLPANGRSVDSSGAIVLKPGYAKTPRAFAGPFVVSIPSVEFTRTEGPARYSDTQVSLAVYWSPGFRPSKLLDLDLVSAWDDKGTDLRREYCFMDGRVETTTGVANRSLLAVLNAPSTDAGRFSLKGRGAVTFSLDKLVLAFKSPEDALGQVRESDSVSIRLETCILGPASTRFQVRVKQKKGRGWGMGVLGTEFNSDNIRLVTTDGQNPGPPKWNASKLENGAMTVDLEYGRLTSKVTALEFVFDADVHRVDFEFEMKDIPLPK